MGVYIPDMELPDNCFRCPAHEWFDFGGKNHGYQCPILRTTKCISNCEARTKRRDNCQMISVHPHGRLIDADAMIRDIKRAVTPTKYIKNRNEDMIAFLEQQETVIPASNN